MRRWMLVAVLAIGCGEGEAEIVETGDAGAMGVDAEPPPEDVTDLDAPAPEDPGVIPTDTPPPKDVPVAQDIKVAGPHLSASPLVINFGATKPNLAKTVELVLKNDGDANLNLVSAKIATLPEEGFSYAKGDPSGLLVPGEDLKVGITFLSQKEGSHLSTITLETLPKTTPIVITLKAIVNLSPPNILVDLTSSVGGVKFGGVPVGKSDEVDFQLVNSGTAPLQIVGAQLEAGSSADFTFKTVPGLPLLLGPASEVKVVATYSPGSEGFDTGVLVIKTDSPSTPVLTVPLRGSGFSGACAGTLVCGPAPLAFGAVAVGQPKALTVVCSNTGFGPVDVQGVDVQLAAGDGFTWTAPAVPATLNGGDGIAVPIVFTPAGTGDKSGKVVITSTDCKKPSQTLDLKASGAEPPALAACGAPGVYEPKTAWEWAASEPFPGFGSVLMAPIVVNLDDDDGDGDIDGQDVPEVVFTAHSAALPANVNDDVPGVLRAIHGKDGSPMWAAGATQVTFMGGLAAAELDGLPGPEIVGIAYEASPPGTSCPGVPDLLPLTICGKYLERRLLAWHGKDGSLFWKSDPIAGAATDTEDRGAPTVADLDGDGVAEVVYGSHVFNGLDGSLRWSGSAGRGTDGHGALSLVLDVDGDKKPEVVAGNTAYRADGTVLWTAPIGDTHGVAAADFDQDGKTEVFINGPTGQSILVDGKTGSKIAGPVDTGVIGCCVGTPAVANLDGAPGLEIVTVGDAMLRVYDAQLNLLWSKAVQDESGAAGPAAFDFEGDGAAEVVHADEANVWILRGGTGEVLFQAARSSRTGLDTPVVADVNGDGHADVLVSLETVPGATAGLRLLSSDAWVATRRVWNQHAYGVGGVYDNAVLLSGPAPSGPVLLRSNSSLCK